MKGKTFLFFYGEESNFIIFTCDTNLNIQTVLYMLIEPTSDVQNLFSKCLPSMFKRHYLPLIYYVLFYKTSVTNGKAFLVFCDYMNPYVVFVDFEEAIHSAVEQIIAISIYLFI